jgi:lipoprotein-releasing system ATP-binding protein
MSNTLLNAAGIHKSYQMGRTQLHVLKGVSLSVQQGEFLAIMGASGSGKSTFLHLLGALDIPDRGRITFNGQDIFAGSNAQRDQLRNQTFGFVFQFYHLLPDLNVLENTVLPGMVAYSIPGWLRNGGQCRRHAAEVLKKFGLGDRLKHRSNELSGGERQRVAIARALANQPQVLLADEPTGNLDAATGKEIMGVLGQLNEEGQTIVMVTHDPQIAAAAHRTVYLVDGKVSAAKGN